MKEDIFLEIRNLIEKKEINKAQQELSKLHTKYKKDPNYLLLRSKIFYINKLYYLAIDTLFIALEFDKNDQIYLLLSEIYKVLGNEDLSNKILDKNTRHSTVESIKDTMTGLYRKNK